MHILVTFLSKGRKERKPQKCFLTLRIPLVATLINIGSTRTENFMEVFLSLWLIRCLAVLLLHKTPNGREVKRTCNCRKHCYYQRKTCFESLSMLSVSLSFHADTKKKVDEKNYLADQTNFFVYRKAKQLPWECIMQSLNTDWQWVKRVNIVISRSKYCSF